MVVDAEGGGGCASVVVGASIEDDVDEEGGIVDVVEVEDGIPAFARLRLAINRSRSFSNSAYKRGYQYIRRSKKYSQLSPSTKHSHSPAVPFPPEL